MFCVSMRCVLLRTLLVIALAPLAAEADDSAYENELGRAMHAYYAGRFFDAHRELNQLIQLFPDDARALYFRGLSAWGLGRQNEARQDFARGAELEQAGSDRASSVSGSLARVQGPARRTLESYRGAVRLAAQRRSDAERLARYGIGTAQPPIDQVAASAAPVAKEVSGAALPMPAAAAAGEKPSAEKVAEDPFAAPAAKEPAAEDPFATPANPPEKAMPAASDTAGAPPAATPAATVPVAAPAAAAPEATAAPAAAATPPAAVEATPDAAIAAAIAAIDDPQKLWVLLPAQYQTDLAGLVHEFGNKMDAEVWDRGFAVAKKLVRVGKEKRDLILKQQMLAAVPGAADHWDQAMDALDTLLASEISTVEGLKTFDPAAFLAGTGTKLAAMAANAKPAGGPGPMGNLSLADLKAAKISTVKTDGDTATIAIAITGRPAEEIAMKRVDGKWLPADMVNGWSVNIGAAKASLEKMNIAAQKPQAMMVLQMADGVLDQLLAAKDEAAFNAALGPIIGMALSQMGGGLGGAMPGAPPTFKPADGAPAQSAPLVPVPVPPTTK